MQWRTRGAAVWLLGWTVLMGAQLGSAAIDGGPIGTIGMLFWIVFATASGCLVTSLWLLRRALLDDSAELGLIAAFAFGVSVFPLVHGLTLPGVLFGQNDASASSAMFALPLAAVAASPLLISGNRTPILRFWRPWVVANLTGHTAIAIGLLIAPGLLPSSEVGSPLAVLLAVGSVAVTLAISGRHMRLYEISRRRSVLAVALAFASIASANLTWINGSHLSAGFWLAHGLDVFGVLGVTVVAALAYRRSSVERMVFRPLTLRNPLDALEYGLDPVVREFVADLECKDPVTADHVRRTAETAVAVGTAMRLSVSEIRTLGLGALLHDVGKLRVDHAILTKPGRLTEDEFDQMREHAALGEQLVRQSVVLHVVAPIVRHHHERVDGNGYPDGLAGDQVPLLARIVSVCDAYDAMAHTRHYRSGMSAQAVRAVLVEHAGTQWDADIVTVLLAAIDAGEVAAEPTAFADVGQLDHCSCDHVVSSAA